MNPKDLIDVNMASIEELTELPGIAEGLARRIVEYRETVHSFEEVIELAAVPGVSERMVHKIADQVMVTPKVMVEKTAVTPPVSLLETAEVEQMVGEEIEIETGIEATKEAGIEDIAGEFDPGSALVEVIEPEISEIEPELEAESDLVEGEPGSVIVDEGEAAVLESELVGEAEAAVLESEFVDETEAAVLEPELVDEVEAVIFEPESAPAVTAPSPPMPKSGRTLGAILLGSLLGAFVGVISTLAILAVLNNGTLSFARADTRLGHEIEDARQVQDDLSSALESLDTEFRSNQNAVDTLTSDLAQQQRAIKRSVDAMSQTLENARADVTELEEMTAALDERLANVADAAETFDKFLLGLRDLMVDLEGAPVPTKTPYGTVTPPITATPKPDSTRTEQATAVPTATGRPTRTPRPTATPIPLPTSTPGQQP